MKNEVRIEGEVAYLRLSGRYATHEAIVDTADLPFLEQHDRLWHGVILKNESIPRPTAYARGKERPKVVYLYRLILGAGKGQEVDHINHDPLDNRRSNLRLTTHAENLQNRAGAQRNSTTGVRGVVYLPKLGVYRAGLKLNGKFRHLGHFKTIEAAEMAAITGRKTLFTHSSESRT